MPRMEQVQIVVIRETSSSESSPQGFGPWEVAD